MDTKFWPRLVSARLCTGPCVEATAGLIQVTARQTAMANRYEQNKHMFVEVKKTWFLSIVQVQWPMSMLWWVWE